MSLPLYRYAYRELNREAQGKRRRLHLVMSAVTPENVRLAIVATSISCSLASWIGLTCDSSFVFTGDSSHSLYTILSSSALHISSSTSSSMAAIMASNLALSIALVAMKSAASSWRDTSLHVHVSGSQTDPRSSNAISWLSPLRRVF